METAKMLNYGQMDQENLLFMHNGVLLSHEEV
jgi:predicted glutamine amidotransferase